MIDIFEMGGLDKFQKVSEPGLATHVMIVGIEDEDYERQFNGMSPLDCAKLNEVINAICLGRPAVLGVAIDTEHVQFSKIAIPPNCKIIWARDAHRASQDDIYFKQRKILGGNEWESGIALLPLDTGKVIQRFQRRFLTDVGPRPSFHWEVVESFCQIPAKASVCGDAIRRTSDKELIFNVFRNHYNLKPISISNLLKQAGGARWKDQAIIRDKVILLGGYYRAARDTYHTPLGIKSGVELIAQAIETEVGRGSYESGNELYFHIFVVEVFLGIACALLHFYCSSSIALTGNLVGIPLLSIIISYLVFSAVGLWVNFIPITAGALIHQLYENTIERQEKRNHSEDPSRNVPSHSDG